MKGIGLVFSGGGGKGAYEIGVWKYLHEIGLDQYVKAVSGTSVGALNAALFVGSSFETAEDLWMNISQDKILTPKGISAETIMKWLAVNGINKINPLTKGISRVASQTVMGLEKITQAILIKYSDDHMFSREGLIEMISDGLDFDKLKTSEIPCYATCVCCQGFNLERFTLNEYSDDEITEYLLASSAIPVIFPSQEINGKKYCDGGIPFLGDNIPVKPVYDTGLEYIIVVHLSQESTIDRDKFPNARIIEIVPGEDLGNAISGTLDFTPSGAYERIQLGYEDARRVMQPMIEMLEMSFANQIMLKKAYSNNKKFQEKRETLLRESEEIKEKMANDGFDDIFEELTKEK